MHYIIITNTEIMIISYACLQDKKLTLYIIVLLYNKSNTIFNQGVSSSQLKPILQMRGRNQAEYNWNDMLL